MAEIERFFFATSESSGWLIRCLFRDADHLDRWEWKCKLLLGRGWNGSFTNWKLVKEYVHRNKCRKFYFNRKYGDQKLAHDGWQKVLQRMNKISISIIAYKMFLSI